MAKTLKELREEARGCQNCTLWANATQTVFGAGDPHARVMLVGDARWSRQNGGEPWAVCGALPAAETFRGSALSR